MNQPFFETSTPTRDVCHRSPPPTLTLESGGARFFVGAYRLLPSRNRSVGKHTNVSVNDDGAVPSLERSACGSVERSANAVVAEQRAVLRGARLGLSAERIRAHAGRHACTARRAVALVRDRRAVVATDRCDSGREHKGTEHACEASHAGAAAARARRASARGAGGADRDDEQLAALSTRQASALVCTAQGSLTTAATILVRPPSVPQPDSRAVDTANRETTIVPRDRGGYCKRRPRRKSTPATRPAPLAAPQDSERTSVFCRRPIIGRPGPCGQTWCDQCSRCCATV